MNSNSRLMNSFDVNQFRRWCWCPSTSPGPSKSLQNTSSDSESVTGSDRLALPDGRTRIISYKAESNDYVVEIKYEWEAKYPEQKTGDISLRSFCLSAIIFPSESIVPIALSIHWFIFWPNVHFFII